MNRILDLSAALGLYDRWATRRLGQVHDTLIELAELWGNEEVLDVGCGTGILSSRLADAAERIMVCGVDIGSRMIGIAEKKARSRHLDAEYHVGSAARLPCPEGRFDVVFSCLLFHLLQDSDKESALHEIFRTLRPGGRYVSAEFEKYPVRFWGRKLAGYPGDLIGAVGFDVHTKMAGPSITRSRPIVYRVMVKPK